MKGKVAVSAAFIVNEEIKIKKERNIMIVTRYGR